MSAAMPATPPFDRRDQADIYREALALARQLAPEWSAGFQGNADYFTRDDPGLAMFKLFGELHGQIAGSLNGVAGKYQLAFWDFLGLSLRAPKAAEAPICFWPKATQPVHIPAGTQIASAGERGLVFSTAVELDMLPAHVSAAIAIRPDADAYSDYTGQVSGQGAPFPLFADDPEQKPIPHALYLGDPMFDFAGTKGKLSLTFEGVNLSPEYFARWSDGTGKRLLPTVQVQNYDQFTITFFDPPDIPVTEVDGVASNWIKIMPAEDIRVLAFESQSLPRIYVASATVELDALPADAAFFNAVSVDLKKGGRPFGKTPALEDAFYLGSKSCLSKPGAAIAIEVQAEPIDPPEQAVIAWEFWNGGGWAALTVQDGTANFTRSGAVTFFCPQIEETSVNGAKNFWIRARIDQGGYGAPRGRTVTVSATDLIDGILAPYIRNSDAAIAALKDQNIDFGYEFKPASYTPPFIDALKITCSLTRSAERTLTQNGTVYAPMTDMPYRPAPDREATFYIGFREADFSTGVLGRDLTVYLAFENEDPSLLPTPRDPDTALSAGALRFEYFSSLGWAPLNAARLAGDFRAEGILALTMPADMVATELFARSLYWIRLLPPETGADRLSPVRGIFPNTVPAFNAVGWTDVVLGSSTGEPSQSFAFPHRPVLEGAVIQVLEPAPGGGSSGGQDITEEWVEWQEVSNFDFATPLSRAYTIDHQKGVLTFGDGVRGVVPPRGNRNVRAHSFRSGGGTAGNRPIGDLRYLKKSNPAVQAVRNVERAVGGVDADSRDDLQIRAPGQVRAGDRAVALSDYEALAVASSQRVVRAAAHAPALGKIEIALLAEDDTAEPVPSFDLRNRVAEYLAARCLPLAAPLLTIGGPDYHAVNVSVQAILTPEATFDTVEKALAASYAAFLDPLTGAVSGAGWRFGSILRASDVADRLTTVPGIMLIDGVTLGADLSFVTFAWNQLPAPGRLSLEVLDANAI